MSRKNFLMAFFIACCMLLFYYLGSKNATEENITIIIKTSDNNTIAEERIVGELREAKNEDFLRLHDGRLARITFAREQAGSTNQLYYRIKGEEDTLVSKILTLSMQVKHVIRHNENKHEWKMAREEYNK